MNGSSRILVFEKPGQPMAIREVPLPTLQAGEMLVRLTCCTICGSDLHSWSGQRAQPAPAVLGHEMVGELVEIAPGTSALDLRGEPLRTGDKVTWSIVVGCGACEFCAQGLPQKCPALFKYGHEKLSEGRELSGGLADYCRLIPGTAVLKISPELPDFLICPANCATATVMAVFARLRRPARSLLIQGAGMLGLTAAAVARARGFDRVLVADPDKKRIGWAENFGATDSIQTGVSADSLQEIVRARTGGGDVEVVMDFCGRPEAIESGFESLRAGGQLIIAGAVYPARSIKIPAEQIVRKLVQINGVHNYLPGDLVEGVDFLSGEGRRYGFEKLVEQEFSLERGQEAFAYARDQAPARLAIREKPATPERGSDH